MGLGGGVVGWRAGYLLASWVTQMYTQFFEFPELHNRVYPGTYLMALASACSARSSAPPAAPGWPRGCSRPRRCAPAAGRRRPRVAGARRLAVAATQLRLADGAAAGDPQPAADRGRHLCGRHGGGSAGHRLHARRGDELPGRLPVSTGQPQRHRPEFCGRPRCRGPGRGPRLPGVDDAEPLLVVGGTFENGPYRHKGAVTGLRAARG